MILKKLILQKYLLNFKRILFLIFIFLSRYSGIYSINSSKNYSKIDFYFDNKNLLEIVFKLAKKRSINIIISESINQDLSKINITYKPEKRFIDLNKAFDLTEFFLNLSGYYFLKKDDFNYQIIFDNISREPLDLYVNINPKDLPNNSNIIRYIYYLKNIKVDQRTDSLDQIFKDMASPGQKPVYLKELNGYMISDKANIVSSISNIIANLDKEGFHESIEFIKINYLPANSIAEILKKLKEAVDPKKTIKDFIGSSDKTDQINHFISNLKIVVDSKENALIIMGRERAVSAVSEFIRNYFDKPIDSGKSILHSYQLQYLDSKEFEPVLINIVSNLSKNSQNNQASESNKVKGPFKNFKAVVVKSQESIQINPIANRFDSQIKESDKLTDITYTGITGSFFSGGNRIFILALDEDWKEIKNLIKKLDQPQPQVLIEALILDVDINNIKKLESTTRSMTDQSFLPSVNTQFLSSNITPVRSVLGKHPEKIAQDLLALTGPDSVPSKVSPGSFLISINEQKTPGIASIIEVLEQYTKIDVQTHPFLAIVNNKKAEISQIIEQRNRGDSSASASGSFAIEIENIGATIKLSCWPHVVNEQKVKLNIGVQIETFIGNSLNKTTRSIITTSNLTNNQVLAIGGLNKTVRTNIVTKTPLLGSIPIVGNLFRGERLNLLQIGIIILIKPTIIMPKNTNKLDISTEYVKQKIDFITADMQDNKIYNFSDPIIKAFIPNRQMMKNSTLISEYIEETKQAEEINRGGLDFNKIKENLSKEIKII